MPSLDQRVNNVTEEEQQPEDSVDVAESDELALESEPVVDTPVDEFLVPATEEGGASEESLISSLPEVTVEQEQVPSPEEIIAAAEEKARQIEQEAGRRGYEEGYKAAQETGYNQALTEFNQKKLPLLDAMSKIIGELCTVKEEILSNVEPSVVQLAEGMARAALLAELRLNHDILPRLAKEGINRLKKTGTITIKLNPALYDLFLSERAELTQLHQEIVFETDPAMPAEAAEVIGPLEEVSVNPLELLDNILEQMREHDAGG